MATGPPQMGLLPAALRLAAMMALWTTVNWSQDLLSAPAWALGVARNLKPYFWGSKP